MVTILGGFAGCISQDTSGKWHIALSKPAADAIEGAAETTTSVLSLLSIFVPGLAGVAGAAAAGTATYKRMKPSLIKNKAVSQHVVKSIETLKKEQPELWTKVKVYMAEDCGADVDAAVKEIVNLIKQAEKTE
jgi:hypothetical protein